MPFKERGEAETWTHRWIITYRRRIRPFERTSERSPNVRSLRFARSLFGPVVLFVSDMHFGRGSAKNEQEKERDLVECLDAHAAEIDHLYLIGDVFDGYIEYRHLVPKGCARFKGLLAQWSDRGVPVTYLFGNHDPWHRDYFSRELGTRLIPESTQVSHFGHRLHVAHGDAYGSTHSLYALVRPLLRNSVAVRLYQSILPADLGVGIARWVSRKIQDDDPDPAVAEILQNRADSILSHDALDAVVLAHSHVPTLRKTPEGTYLNTGNWYEARTFARLDEEGLHLQRWNGARAEDIESVPL